MKDFGAINTQAYHVSGEIGKLIDMIRATGDETLIKAFERHMDEVPLTQPTDFLDFWDKVLNAVFHGQDGYDKGFFLEAMDIVEQLPHVEMLSNKPDDEIWVLEVVTETGESRVVCYTPFKIYFIDPDLWNDEIGISGPWGPISEGWKGVSNVKAGALRYALMNWENYGKEYMETAEDA